MKSTIIFLLLLCSYVSAQIAYSPGRLAIPSQSPAAGSYGGTQLITPTIPAGSYACYTTNGATPVATASSCSTGTHYTSGTISIASTSTLKMHVCKAYWQCSLVSSDAYTISATFSIVQSKSNCNTGATVRVTLTSPTTAGNGLLVMAAVYNSLATTWSTTVTNNSEALTTGLSAGISGYTVGSFAKSVVTTGTTYVDVSDGSSVDYCATVWEVTGLATSSAYDGVSTVTTGATTPWSQTITPSTTGVHEALFSFSMPNWSLSGQSFTAPTVADTAANFSGGFLNAIAGHREITLTSGSAYTISGTTDGSNATYAYTVAYKLQ